MSVSIHKLALYKQIIDVSHLLTRILSSVFRVLIIMMSLRKYDKPKLFITSPCHFLFNS